ncbi:MAG: hypothetical protein H7Y12_08505 [Sphingobacteriaceae bacterium]|nr:hypothetical protein [Cytophagaceae bacterium]
MKTLPLLLLFLTIATTTFAQKFIGTLRGTVVFKRGNLMPGPNRPQAKGQPVKRELQIYELTKMAQATPRSDVFYESVKTKLVKKVRSDSQGRFRVSLPAGTYSVFVLEPGKGLYANVFDGEMNALPVDVKAGKTTTVEVEINYAAVY